MEGVFAGHGERVAGLLGAWGALILDPEDQWHKGGKASLALDDLVSDMSDVAGELAGVAFLESDDVAGIADADDVALFRRWAKPIVLDGKNPDDAVGYVQPADQWASREQADRDARMLALAGVRAFAQYVTSECKGHGRKAIPDTCACRSMHWALYRGLSAELWLRPGELAQVLRMADAIRKGIDARWVRKVRPTASRQNKQDPARVDASGDHEEGIMGKTTTTTTSKTETAVQIVTRMAESVKAGNLAAALAAVADGEREHPAAQLPQGASWAKLRAVLEARQTAQVADTPAQSQSDQTGAVASGQDETVQATPVAPVQTRATLYLVHTVDGGTKLLGTNNENGPEISAVMGSTGQRWNYHRVEKFRYLGNSRGYAADRERLEWAALALRSQGWGVEFEIDDTDHETGDPAPVKADSQQRRSRIWEVRMHAKRLAREAGILDDSAEEPAAIAAIAAPVAQPVQPAAPVQVKDAPQQAPQQVTDLSGLDIRTVIALVKAGDTDAAAEIERRMLDGATPTPAPTRQAARPAVRTAEPVRESVQVADGPTVLTFRFADGANTRHTAREVRRYLYAEITVKYRKLGVEIHVNDGRKDEDRLMRVTVTIAGASDRKRTEIVNAAKSATMAIEGVAGYAAV